MEVFHHHYVPRCFLAFIGYLLHWKDSQYSEFSGLGQYAHEYLIVGEQWSYHS